MQPLGCGDEVNTTPLARVISILIAGQGIVSCKITAHAYFILEERKRERRRVRRAPGAPVTLMLQQ